MSHNNWQGTTNQPLGLQQQRPASIVLPFYHVTVFSSEANDKPSFKGSYIKHTLENFWWSKMMNLNIHWSWHCGPSQCTHQGRVGTGVGRGTIVEQVCRRQGGPGHGRRAGSHWQWYTTTVKIWHFHKFEDLSLWNSSENDYHSYLCHSTVSFS